MTLLTRPMKAAPAPSQPLGDSQCPRAAVPKLLTPGTSSMEEHFSVGEGGGFSMIQVCYIYCALYFYYYYISSTSDHQALDPQGWRPLLEHELTPLHSPMKE